jgi:3'(2'), 5'-bisphosphate nucleotidase
MVAEGVASLYFRAGTTMYWDSAAGHIIAKAAGAYVNKWGTYEELTYRENKMINPAFMVMHPEWCEQILG